MENRLFLRPLSVPSWVIPGTYAENLRFIGKQDEIRGVELLFFMYDDDIRRQFLAELEEIKSFSGRFVFTAHLPETLAEEHEELVEILSPLVRHFIVHPGKAGNTGAQAALINKWAEKFSSAGAPRFLAENTNPGLLEKTLPLLSPLAGLCMDTGHLLLEDRSPAEYFSRHIGRISEIHLHGMDREKAETDGRLPDHRPLKEDAPWFRELFPLIENFKGIVNLEVFSWEEAAQSIAAIQGMAKQTDKEMKMENIGTAMINHLDNLTKPRGSLGKLETFCVKMAEIQGRVPPEIRKKGIYVFAGDHGIAAEGVSLYPQEVTRQMILNVLSGGAGINALGNGAGWEITMVDAGTAGGEFPPDAELKPVCRFIRAGVRGGGSGNFYREPALTKDEVKAALEKGRNLALDAAERGFDLTAVGDLGIGNTSAAAAMLTAAGFDAADMTDRGTGIDEAMLEHKKEIIRESVKRRAPAKTGEAILEQLGSADLAMMAGFILGLENRKIACVLDGFPVTAAAYMAYLINPGVTRWLFAGHLSRVAGHKPVLEKLGLEPIVNLDMRLGEGTGAAIGGHIVELGVLAARNMASFSQAHVSDTDKKEEKY